MRIGYRLSLVGWMAGPERRYMMNKKEAAAKAILSVDTPHNAGILVYDMFMNGGLFREYTEWAIRADRWAHKRIKEHPHKYTLIWTDLVNTIRQKHGREPIEEPALSLTEDRRLVSDDIVDGRAYKFISDESISKVRSKFYVTVNQIKYEGKQLFKRKSSVSLNIFKVFYEKWGQDIPLDTLILANDPGIDADPEKNTRTAVKRLSKKFTELNIPCEIVQCAGGYRIQDKCT